ncbi:MAG: efflux RND transporter periplasmic adaptor subunit [Candidatus Omnitrophota bacterium]
MKNSTKKILFLLIFILICIFFLRLVTKPVQKHTQRQAEGEKIRVKVTTVKKGDLNLILSYVGSIKAKDEINVFSKVTGKLAQYSVNEGDSIAKGQIIALVDRDETGLKYELAPVESPISGIVGRTMLDKGSNILTTASITSGTPVAIIVNMEEMIVKLNIPEPDIGYIKKGLKAQIQVDAFAQENFQGEISKVSEVVDTQTRTLPIEIIIPNKDHRLKSGMFARLQIIASVLKDRLYLPQDALIKELGVNYLFVVENSTAKKKKINTGIQDSNRIEILEGVNEGDSVIVFGQQGLKDGTSVEIVKD